MKQLHPRRLIVLLLCLGLSAGLAACGNRHELITEAETEGPYLNVGALKYQVQISRPLNPADEEDRLYLRGVPAEEAELRADQTWFAVFVRVVNETGRTHPSAEEFEIEDTEGKRFEPITVTGNTFAYQPTEVPPRGTLPPHGTLVDSSPIGGQMVLFKLTLNALANRPLELLIRSPQAEPHEAVVDLDV